MAQAAIPIAATVFSAASQMSKGRAAKAQADSAASQMDANANIARRDARTRSEEINRQTARTMSDAESIQAGSGFSGSDGAAARQIARIGGAGKYNELAALYAGEMESREILSGAATTRASGRNARNNAYLGAAATALGGIADYRAKRPKNNADVSESKPVWRAS